jgi:hypothetical protein
MNGDERQTGRAGEDSVAPAGGRVLSFRRKPGPVSLERAVLDHFLAAVGEDGEIRPFLREAALDPQRREESRAAEEIPGFERCAVPRPGCTRLLTACSRRKSLVKQGPGFSPVEGPRPMDGRRWVRAR